ncbi:MAG: hypothetical protein KDN20_12740 [Verrucomicrobiae bacterium]|nr:hypothetical protein [Verrucomicrobiae bacterium]
MKKILALMAVVALAAGSAYAGCGKKVTDEGKVTSFDADTKALVVELKGGKSATLTATPTTEAKSKDGKKTELADLVGKSVKVVSEHKKIDSVSEA